MKSWIVRDADPKTVGEIVALAREEATAIDEGRVFVGKRRVTRADHPVKAGDEVRIGRREATVVAAVIAEAPELVAVAKPAGIPTVPDHQGASHALVAIVARMLGKRANDLRVTSRLDRDVSGAVVFALSESAEARLKAARARGEYRRRYVALASAEGEPLARGRWASPIDGKESATRVREVARAGGVALLALDPETGRTHQIRIHASRARFSLLGDRAYGGPSRIVLGSGRILSFSRVALHAARVAVSGIVAEAPIPEELARVWTELGGAPEAWNTAVSCDISEDTPSRSSSP